MKILFITGSLEFGKGGVADYTRLLAEECVRRGHRCQLLALYDWHIDQPEETDSEGVQSLRLPAAMSWEDRVRLAKNYRQSNQPDWISLQFVVFNYQVKGLLWKHYGYFKEIIGETNLQVMFHETWTGIFPSSSMKHKLVGIVQRALVKRFFKKLPLKCAHTHCTGYAFLLNKLGIPSSKLPLFGGIPVSDLLGEQELCEEVSRSGLAIDPDNLESYLIAVTFGSLYAKDWRPDDLFHQLQLLGEKFNRRPVILSIGGPGGELEIPAWRAVLGEYHEKVHLLSIGWQPEHRVSAFLNAAHFGIACTPSVLIEKSSSAAAMLEHGLTLVLARDKELFRGLGKEQFVNHPQCHPLSSLSDITLSSLLKRGECKWRLPEIAEQFLSSLH